MKISTQTIVFITEHYGSVGDPALPAIDQLVAVIGAQLAAVEDVTDFGKRFEEVIIVKVVACDDHPSADRLHVCTIDDGGKVQGVERNEQGLVQIVCGAPNVRAGMLAAWLPPGSTVPSTLQAEPFVLEARALRGVVSNGMLASPKELTLGDNHEGILEIDEDVTPGTMFADAYSLRGDVVIDMENKMFTHRPDCFGWLGLAREIAGIRHHAFKSIDWYRSDPELPPVETDELPLEVTNELPDLVPRFSAVALRDAEIKPSPVWLQIELVKFGLRPINNIVDYTNYHMLLTGQPIHAYDYDKVKAFSGGDKAVLTVRHPRPGETITLLNGKTIEPREDTMMVVAGDHLACVGGAMGGADTEVDNQTKNIILEAATWDMYTIRKIAMHHGIFTDAVTRFTKGQSPLQNAAVLAKITTDLREAAGAKVASPLIDNNQVPEEARVRGNIHAPVSVTVAFINERLGWNLPAEEMRTLLTNVEFAVELSGDELTVAAPFWRTDIAIPEDIVEEIGRLNGYDKLPLDLPRRDLTPPPRSPLLELKRRLRDQLAAAGANEVLAYSFVHGNLLDKAGQDRGQAFQLANALSPDLQYYRLSLTPSLLEKIHPNIKAEHEQFALFEIGKAHSAHEQAGLDEQGLPREVHALGFVFAASPKAAAQYAGAPYYQVRKYLDLILGDLGLVFGVVLEPLATADLYDNPWIEQMTAPYEPQRSAVLRDEQGLIWGVVGEFRPSVRKDLKLPAFAAGFELDPLLLLQRPNASYLQLPRFPRVAQDLCLKVATENFYKDIRDLVAENQRKHAPNRTFTSLAPVDIYQRPEAPGHKQITLRLTFANYDRTLTDQEVAGILDQIAAAAKERFGAERV
jgi:phenylalanyl-tRNA synthetase beta chain